MPKTAIPAFALERLEGAHIEDGLDAAPVLSNFSNALAHIVRCIHGIPALFQDGPLNEIAVYLGRSAAAPRNLIGRFAEHDAARRQDFGAILMVGPTKTIQAWEGIANRVLGRIKDRGVLCVDNVAIDGRGSVPQYPESAIYMTWRFGCRREIRVATRRDIQSIASQVADDMNNPKFEDALAAGLDPLSRPRRDFVDLYWHEAHRG